jgi:hypothetical protein
MVTKMKMFGFFHDSQVKNHQVKNKEQISSPISSSQFNMKNLAAIMKIQNTGCKSCRG